VNACENGVGRERFMAAPQCNHLTRGKPVTREMCLPTPDEIVR